MLRSIMCRPTVATPPLRRSIRPAVSLPLLMLLTTTVPGLAQEGAKEQAPAAESSQSTPPELSSDAELIVEPLELTLEVGTKAQLTAKLVDRGEELTEVPVVFFSRDRRKVGVNAAGAVEAHGPGEVTLVALVPKDPEDRPRRAEALLRTEITVTVPKPPVATVSLVDLPQRLYVGTSLRLTTRIVDRSGVERNDVRPSFSSDDPSVATVDAFGHLTLVGEGRATLIARAEEASGTTEIRVRNNPTVQLELSAPPEVVRTGDVVRFQARGVDARGRTVEDLPIQFTVAGEASPDIIAPGAKADIASEGNEGVFVAERSGVYSVVASAGTQLAVQRVSVDARDVRKTLEFVGQGRVGDRHTSDLWVWQGADGNDYAITGTWGAEGHAYIWDVTAPENITLIDTVRVDARTVNDVKINEDATLAVISREGASNRKNGLVILDISEPQLGVRILSRYDDQLRGGVHNVFVHADHVYAVNNGRRFDIISIEDPAKPYRVGRFELDTPGHSIHDVWVVEGIAFTSNWGDGVYAIDVGGGGQGGAPNNPVALGSYQYPSGWNHAAFPYRSESTGKFYVFAGDEAFPYGLTGRNPGEAPPRADGWIHIVEWDDWKNPREVARYQVPEAGTHNFWIENDVLYVAYYNGGLRVVDISGELRGDLYRQGREIASFMPFDAQGYIPNSPFTWGPQPHKGTIFFSDWNSGLWAVRYGSAEADLPEQGEPQ